jgi:hypothetical protein
MTTQIQIRHRNPRCKSCQGSTQKAGLDKDIQQYYCEKCRVTFRLIYKPKEEYKPHSKGYKMSDIGKENIRLTKLGSKNPNWKGNNISATEGRHRARVALKAPKGVECHHIDGNPLNNNLENLVLVTHREHMLLDGRLAKLQQTEECYMKRANK